MSKYNLSNTLDSDKLFLINLSDIERRIDPNPYHSERINELKRLDKLCCKKLKTVVISSKAQTKTIKKDDIYIGLENIKSDTGEYIKTEEKETISSANIFKCGQILFPKLRPYLNKVFLAHFNGICSTEFHVFNALNLKAEYLAIYLRSSFVFNQTKHLMTGNTLPRLQTEDINNIPVPIISNILQQKIIDHYNLAFKFKQQKEVKAKELLESIDTYLLNKLGITIPDKDESLENRVFYTNISEVTNGRFDPKLYDNNTKAIRTAIQDSKYNDKPKLKELVIHSVAGDWGKDPKDKLTDKQQEEYTKSLVIRATEFDNLYNLKLDNSRVKYRLINNDKLKRIDVQPNDLLIEKSGGSPDQPVGRISIIREKLVSKHNLGYSNFIHKIRVNTNRIQPEYLFCFLKTVHNIKLTDAMQSQTNGIRNLIMSNYFNQIIPLPNIEKQTEIANHINSLRTRAKELEIEAKQVIKIANKEIEKLILEE